MSGRRIVIMKLLATPAVQALCGDRVWPTMAPQDAARPYLVLTTPGQENRQLLEGDADYPRTRIRIEAVADSAAAADLLAEAAFNALKNVTNEYFGDDESPHAFEAFATIMAADMSTDGYSDNRNGFVSIADYYVDWRRV